MSLVQMSMFAEEEAAPKPCPPNPHHARSRLEFMLNQMRGASNWPWSEDRVRFFCETLWPQSYAALPPEEAAHWRNQIEAEAARLDARG